MALPDLGPVSIPSPSASDEQISEFLRRFLPDFYFVNAPLSRMRRHVALLQSLTEAGEGVTLDFHRAAGASFSELALCARDSAHPGLLSNIAGVLAATGVQVHTAWIHSLDAPNGEGERFALDTFILGESAFGRSRALGIKTQKTLSTELSRVTRGEGNADELLAKAGRARQKAARAPLRVSDASAIRVGEFTRFQLRAFDSNGVFYRITRALARRGVHIEHAQINTFESEADDVFFVLDAGTRQPFPDEDAARILETLREELGRSE